MELKKNEKTYLNLTMDYPADIVNINRYAGCDDYGLLTGIIGELGLKVPVEGTSGTGEKFADYRKKIEESLSKGTAVNLNKEIQSLRMKMEEIDLYTVIVPLTVETQPGDIVIAGNNLAVVTETSAGGELKETKAVWMGKKKAEKGKLEEFLAAAGKSESEIEIRRLLKEKKTSTTGEYHAPYYDILSKAMTGGYEVEIEGFREETQKGKENWRFIPNTGEYLIVEGLKIKRTVNLPLNVKEVEFIGAEDRGYSKDKTGQGNIYNNSAKEFQAAILGKNGRIAGSERKLVRDGENPESYQLEEGKKSYLFETFMSDKELFYVDATTKIRNMNAKLGIRPTDSAHAYPGDDLVLKFKVKTPYGDCIVKTSEKDYIAVYDKKMLWRANLYIDEGAGDWNNMHPWNAPAAPDKLTETWADSENKKTYLAGWNATDWGYNEWNKIISYNTDGTVASSVNGNGGQQPIFEWTRFNGGNVSKSVAYGWGCWDSFEQFNRELIEQRAAIKKYREDNPESDYASLQWIESQTTAPGTENDAERWKNYVFESNAATDKNGQNRFSEINADVSVPGLSTYWDEPERDGFSSPKHDKYTSGTDCSGLVAMSANYSGNKYKLNNIDETIAWVEKTENTTTEVNKSLAIFVASEDEPWQLILTAEQEKNKGLVLKRDSQRKILTYAVPGDILDKQKDHVVIINDITITDGKVMSFDDIKVIHSCSGLNVENLLNQF